MNISSRIFFTYLWASCVSVCVPKNPFLLKHLNVNWMFQCQQKMLSIKIALTDNSQTMLHVNTLNNPESTPTILISSKLTREMWRLWRGEQRWTRNFSRPIQPFYFPFCVINSDTALHNLESQIIIVIFLIEVGDYVFGFRSQTSEPITNER